MPSEKGAISSYAGPSLADQQSQSGGLFSCCFGPTIRKLEIPPPPHKGKPFLPHMKPALKGRKTLSLDLDETLVHSSFTPVDNPDYIIPVEMEGEVWRDASVLLRGAIWILLVAHTLPHVHRR